GVDDQLVAGAATDVAGEQLADLRAQRGVAGPGAPGEAAIDDVRGAHRDPRGADPALRAAADDQLALHRVQQIAVRQALDGGHPAGIALPGGDQARVDGLAVEHHGARAALALAAALLGAGQPQILAQHVEQPLPRRYVDRAPLAVDLEREFHGASQRG